MNAAKAVKPKRHRKKKPRTEGRFSSKIFATLSSYRTVSSDISDSEAESKKTTTEAKQDDRVCLLALTLFSTINPNFKVSPPPKSLTDTEVSAAFTKFYMQQAAAEFADDLDKVRTADDFKDDALPLLINALQQGASGFSIEDQRRIVTAAREKDGKGVRK